MSKTVVQELTAEFPDWQPYPLNGSNVVFIRYPHRDVSISVIVTACTPATARRSRRPTEESSGYEVIITPSVYWNAVTGPVFGNTTFYSKASNAPKAVYEAFLHFSSELREYATKHVRFDIDLKDEIESLASAVKNFANSRLLR